jgi:hypothetical protein
MKRKPNVQKRVHQMSVDEDFATALKARGPQRGTEKERFAKFFKKHSAPKATF